MAKGASIEVEGIKEFRRDLKRAGDKESIDLLKQANREAAEVVSRAARPIAPERSGKLAASIRTAATQRAGIVRIGKAKVPYAGPIHFGWPKRKIRPQPFLYDAIDKRTSDVIEIYRKRVEELVEKITSE